MIKSYLLHNVDGTIKQFTRCDETEIELYQSEYIEVDKDSFEFDSNFTYKIVNNEIIKSEITDSSYLSYKRKLLIQEIISKIEVEYNGKIYQGDESSQNRISKAINGLIDDLTTTEWKSKDNSWNVVTRIDLQQILFLACNEQTRILKDN